jgi:hypothetical protein
MINEEYFQQKKEKAAQIYNARQIIYNPFFKQNVVLNSDGFHHLRYAMRRERNKEEQVLKFTLMPLGLHILKTATTLQEYRKGRYFIEGEIKTIEWWGFIAIFVKQEIKIRVVTRKVGDGNIHFWSVMPYSHLKRGKSQKLFTEGIEDE